MRIFLSGAFGLVVVVGLILLCWRYYLRLRVARRASFKYGFVKPVIDKLSAGKVIDEKEIMLIANDPTLRHVLYRFLRDYNRLDLFPPEFLTIQKGAECYLVTWLEFPTELAQVPHEIEFMEKIVLENIQNATYFVFKFRMRGNHWATEHGWMVGVVGPYKTESEAYDIPRRIYSRFISVDQITPEQEVLWVHDNI